LIEVPLPPARSIIGFLPGFGRFHLILDVLGYGFAVGKDMGRAKDILETTLVDIL
jgi:hypothetical protein